MKKQRLLMLVFASTLLFSTSCEKETANSENREDNKIIGTWIYERQYYGSGTYTVVFKEDLSFNGQLGYYASEGEMYTLKDEVLTLIYRDGYSISYEVQALTDNRMVLYHPHSGHSYSLTKEL